MMTSALRRLASSLSSHSMVVRSRWLVGSSSSRISGEGASTRASAARRASPPETCAGSSSPCKPSCSRTVAGLIVVVAGAEAGLDIGQRRGREVAEIRLLRQIADGGARLHEAAAAVGSRPGRPRSSAASICRSRCGRSDTRARPTTPTVRRPTTAACRRRSARCLSTGSAEAPWRFNSTLFLRRLLRALALDAADGLIERRQERRAVARSERFGSAGAPRRMNADRSSDCEPPASSRSIVR